MYTTISTKNMDRNEWLKIRKTGLGGSDAGAVCGLNPYVSPMAVYRDKVSDETDMGDNEAMRQGRDLEEYVAEKAECDVGITRTKNTLAAVSAQSAAAKAGRELMKNQREIYMEVSTATSLTRPMVEALIDKVMIFPDDRIEISYIPQDFIQ